MSNTERQQAHRRRRRLLATLDSPAIVNTLLGQRELFGALEEEVKRKRKGWTVLDTALIQIASEMMKIGVSLDRAAEYVKSIDPKEFVRLVTDESAYFGILIQRHDSAVHGPTTLKGSTHIIAETRDES